ncbi:MAG TPA: putative Ig domain-containing protein [Rhodocyclaceae bacterium]|nr:putative Ig domain-containing protein [Rhodocyclaceae bacterium]
MAEDTARESGGRFIQIGQTPAAELLNSLAFKDALTKAVGTSDSAIIGGLFDGVINADGTRTPGMWDIASKSLADAAVGDVRTITPFADAGKVFAKTELPALLANSKVTSINGISRSVLIAIRDAALSAGASLDTANNAVFKLTRVSSIVAGATLDVVNGTERMSLLRLITLKASGAAIAEAVNVGTVVRDSVVGASEVIGKLGTKLAVVMLLVTTWQVGVEVAAGRYSNASDIFLKFAKEFTSSLAAGWAAAELTGMALSPLLAGGPLGEGTWLAATFVAGIAGGIFGEAAVASFIASFQGGESGPSWDTAKAIELASRTDGLGLSYRYALLKLDPLLLAAPPSDMADRLKLYDPDTHTGEITEKWLEDRSKLMGYYLNKLSNLADFGAAPGVGIHYEDKATGTIIETGVAGTGNLKAQIIFGIDNGAEANDTLTGANLDDHLYGGGGNDQLNGGLGDDYLEGDAGDDQLTGGKDRDTLVGGAGNDTYMFAAGDGQDVIDDSDGQGQIRIGNDVLNGAKEAVSGTGVWQSTDKEYTYQLLPGSDGTQTLSISIAGTNDRILVKHFTSGNLGINLNGGAPAPVDLTITGDLEPVDNDPATAGTQYVYDKQDNVIVTAAAHADRADILYDGAGNDSIDGKGGDDIITAARGGNDSIDAGAGEDLVFAGTGEDQLVGGTGLDRLFGEAGQDRLYAQYRASLSAAIALGETQTATGQRGDWLDGGNDDDVLVGDAGNDALLGGDGADIIVGGGNDDIFGDLASSGVQADWTLTRSVGPDPTNPKITQYKTTWDKASYSSPTGGADLIYAGAGDDWVSAGAGADYVEGGTGADVIFGEAGDDDIRGGDGNDVLSGDNVDGGSGGLAGTLHGNDYIEGGEGNDRLTGNGGNDELFGDAGNDTLQGDDGVTPAQFDGQDYLDGGDGNDSLLGNGNDDELFGGNGDDTLWGDSDQTPADKMGKDYLDGEAGNDQLAGSGNDDVLFGGSGNDTLWGDGGATPEAQQGNDYLDGEDGNDYLDGSGGNDTLMGGAGTDTLRGGKGNDTFIHGAGDGNDQYQDDAGDDTLVLDGWSASGVRLSDGLAGIVLSEGGEQVSIYGLNAIEHIRFGLSEGSETMTLQQLMARQTTDFKVWGTTDAEVAVGGSGNDTLGGGGGADTLSGGRGNDLLMGQGGTTYRFGRDDGQDRISNGTDTNVPAATQSVLELISGIAPADVFLKRVDNDLVVHLRAATDQVTVLDYFAPTGTTSTTPIEQIKFADDTVWDAAYVQSHARVNSAPVLQQGLPAITAVADRALNFVVPADTFVDPDPDDVLTYSATLGDGAPLPAWLSFDPITRVLSGTPEASDIGSVDLWIWATDSDGAEYGSNRPFSVALPNHAPILGTHLLDTHAAEDMQWSWTIPGSAFSDMDVGDVLTFSARRADGGAWPAWLNFDAETRTFRGSPTNSDVGMTDIQITATDRAGATVSDHGGRFLSMTAPHRFVGNWS